MTIRPPAVAGTFYPYDRNELKEMVDAFLVDAKSSYVDGDLKALIVPHAGYVYSGPVAAVGYKLLKKMKPKTEHVFLLGPSHFARFRDVAQSASEYWETPLGKVEMEQLPESQFIKNNSLAHEKEHCLEVQLPFLQRVLGKFSCYALLTGDVSTRMFANELSRDLGENSMFIVSSDLSHYHPYNQAVRIDSLANKSIPAGDIDQVEKFVEACGRDAITTIMQIAKLKRWNCEFLDYKNSGDTSGMKDQVVGYGCYAFYE